MKGRYFRIVLCVVAMVLLVPVVVAVVGCSSGGGVMAMMNKLPEDAGGFVLWDIATMRGDDDLDEAYDDFEDGFESSYGFLGIYPDDVDRVADGGSVTILEGRFDLEDVRDELKDNDYDDDEYKDIETWDGDMSVALVSESCIVFAYEMDDLRDCIDVIKGDDDSLGDDEDISAVVDRLPGGIVAGAYTSGSYEGCEASGYSMDKKDSETALVTMVLLFDDEEAAEDAKKYIEDTDEDDYENLEVTQDGEFVVVTGDWDIDRI